MLLGDLMSRFGDAATAEQNALSIGDIVLLTALREAADAAGLGIGEFMADAVQHYSAGATDEEWLSLMAALGRGEDPARLALERMLRWSLAHGAQACPALPRSAETLTKIVPPGSPPPISCG
jgi:hypothetical protein